MSLDEILKIAAFALAVVNFLVTTGLWFYVRSSNRHEKIDERFADLERNFDGRIDKAAERLAALEADARRAPTHEDLARIYDRINVLATNQSETKGTLDNMATTMRQLVNELIKQGLAKGEKA